MTVRFATPADETERQLDTVIVWPSERSAGLYRREGLTTPEELLEPAFGE